MSDPREIYLQPECCANEYEGRIWCEDDAPVDCEDGVPWTKYVIVEEYDRLRELLREAQPYVEQDDNGNIRKERIGKVLNGKISAALGGEKP
jgi:hypothetical protein